ncbi:extended synaptotagmin-2 [Neocloeon triangulifer]|uniref:extended synaptotagmin-2 n=1 Tax=Neocloeon triangulifer TaxID=2078957 RepID=UPI00286ECF4F|nr:extended synaptotagmin-2 [Neocloeon triangulifer]
MLGFFQLSAAWMICPIMILIIRDECKRETKSKQQIFKRIAMTDERDVIMARVKDLPSWVFFPDVERAEWMNKIFKLIWPNVNSYARDLIKNTIEPVLQEALLPYKLGDFKFERIVLGNIPPRIGGIKVYDQNVSRSEIIMDIDLFYGGDCDITFSAKGIKGGIKDFQVSGLVRVVMKPLLTQIPLVGGLQVFFLNNPEIDFNLVGIADVLDFPGLRDVLQRIISEQVAAMMVLPNKFPILLSEEVPAQVLKTPEPEGVLRIHLVEARNLMKMDISVLGEGKSDPYTVLTIGSKTYKTQIIEGSVNPKWDYWCEVEVSSFKAQEILIQVWDWDRGFPGYQNHDFLGKATIDINTLVQRGQSDMWIPLEEAKHGDIHLRFTWFGLSTDRNDLAATLAETKLLHLNGMSSALFIIYIDCAKQLRSVKDNKKPDPYFVINLGSKSEQSAVVMRTNDPVWEVGYTFLVQNPDSDTLHIKVMDQKTTSELGSFTYNLVGLYERRLLQVNNQPFRLKGAGPGAKIFMSMQLRILKKADVKSITIDKSGGSSPVHKKEPKRNFSTDSASLDTVSVGSIKAAIEPLVESSIAPAVVNAAPPSSIIESGLRRRGTIKNTNIGSIQMTIGYSHPRQRLVVTVHKIENLPLDDPTNPPDPYVKLHLLPDKSKEHKRKTETVKDDCNPNYEETFEYVMSEGELHGRKLEVSVLSNKNSMFSSNPLMGQVVITLSELDLSENNKDWYTLLKA